MKYSDEKILGALLSQRSIRRAAGKLGCTQKTISDRLKKPEFRELYNAAKSEQLEAVCATLTSALCGAVSTLCDVMSDGKAPQSVRVSAADALLRHGLRYVEIGEIEKRLTALEQNVR